MTRPKFYYHPSKADSNLKMANLSSLVLGHKEEEEERYVREDWRLTSSLNLSLSLSLNLLLVAY